MLLRLAATFEADLGDLERAEKALVQVLSEHPKDAAALASLDRIYETQGMYDNLSAVLKPADRDHRRWSEELVKLHLRLGRVNAEALDDVEGAIASYLAVLEQESRSLEALEALERLYFRSERWVELYGVYEKMVDIAKDDAEIAAAYARMARLATDALDQRVKAVELWGRVLDLRGPDATALAGLADLHEAAEEWKELTEILEQLVVAVEDVDAKHPDLQAAGTDLGREAGARAQLARELAEGAGARSAGRRRPARHRRQLQIGRGLGRSCPRRCAA